MHIQATHAAVKTASLHSQQMQRQTTAAKKQVAEAQSTGTAEDFCAHMELAATSSSCDIV
jgi:hypothetical protein